MAERRATNGIAMALTVAASALLVCTAGAADRSNRITQTSIGGVTLGGSPSDYTRTLGSPDFTTRMPGSLVRMTFAGGRIQVFLRGGRGVAIMTASDQLRTAQGVGPCVRLARLRQAYG